MKIDIDDSLLSRHNELLMNLIKSRRNIAQKGNQQESGGLRELESVEQKIINAVTGAYFNRGNDENNT